MPQLISEIVDDPQTLPESTPPRPLRWLVLLSLFLLSFGAIALSRFSWQQSSLFIIGSALGGILLSTRFGFTGAYRKFLVERDATGMYAQLLMLAIATVLFAPILAKGEVSGAIADFGVAMEFGALIFGIGMQLATGCASGTLTAVGGGSLAMLITLMAFCTGAFLGSLTRFAWIGLPSIEGVALGEIVGWGQAAAIQIVVFLGLAWLLYLWEKREKPSQLIWQRPQARSLCLGAIALAVLNTLVLAIAQHPWAITWGFVLISGKIATGLGWDLANHPYWGMEFAQTALTESIFADITVVMNLGVILGAILVAASNGSFALKTIPSWRVVIASIIGGLAMGYGALLSFGCNVNAFFGAIASTSLHGWLWIIFALMGNAIGIKLRTLFVPN